MNRRVVLIVVLALSLSLFGFLLYSSGFGNRLNKFYVSDAEWNEIIGSRSENKELDFSAFRINHEIPFLSDECNLYYSIIEGDSNRLNPAIQLGGGLKLAIKGEHISDMTIEKNIQQDLMIYNNKSYRLFKLTTTSLPLLSIDYPGDEPSTRDDVELSMKLYDNRSGVFERIIKSEGETHKRGASSFSLDKNSYTIKLTQESLGNTSRPNPKSLLGMRESANWMIHNIVYDFEHVRDYFASKLWGDNFADNNSFNIHNGTEWEYVELIENGKYSGLYLLGHKPDKEMIGYDENAEHPDIMFKASEDDEFYNFVTDKTNYLAFYELETDGIDREYAYSVLKDYMKSLYGNDLNKLDYYSDFGNAVDYNLFINMVQNIDIPRYAQGMIKNSYISFKWKDDHYVAILTPWDYDMALGSNNLGGLMYDMSVDQNVILSTDYVAARRRAGDREIYGSLAVRYTNLRQGALTNDKVSKIIDDAELKIFGSGAHLRDLNRWPYYNHSDVNLKLSAFKEYFLSRLAYLDSYYNKFNFASQENSDLFAIPNYVSVYLDSGIQLDPSDPNYFEVQTEPVDGIDNYTDTTELVEIEDIY